jgi:hypothetical protein
MKFTRFSQGLGRWLCHPERAINIGNNEREKMKKKAIAISLLTVAALFGTTVSASADANSDYKAAVEAYKVQLKEWNEANKAQQASYKSAVASYSTAKKAEGAAKKAIADKFKTDAAAAKARADAAVAAATTAEAKKAAKAAGKAEMESIIVARNTALASVVKAGNAPVKPTPVAKPVAPVKPTKAPKPAKTPGTGSPSPSTNS